MLFVVHGFTDLQMVNREAQEKQSTTLPSSFGWERLQCVVQGL